MPEGPRFRTATVVGLGAMGGSVAKGVLRRLPGVPVFGVDPDGESAARAARDGVRVVPRLRDCDVDGGVVVFAAPLDATVRLVRETAPVWRGAALATDVASLKAGVLEAASAAPASSPFVGAHPMCGSERSGYSAARADLFDSTRVWLCPAATGDAASGAEAAARGFWSMLGARPRTIAAERHDRVMALVSHLPQLLSNALAATLEDAGVSAGQLGPGGRDMTRLAGSSPSMWLPLLEAAAGEDAAALRAVEHRIAAIRGMLESGDLRGVETLMDRGGRWVSAEG
ncbi:MAG: prephenate dehydrogenase/arogenate dehydrogenase family protein [Gemmatimonadetes bacterium]|nr:prephenate dehydrogenase/arogenate dehydrogenase family protein [Gemmatimonadota bacterium]MXX71597.1 prephenate dehydrogenase/arogenate dehydrogenase family protein [Gemmatimonadota bacterium]MYC92153.1 prephenate dehydrogenase/arogenate dehydrogenase family protein [Gemmatimonadota bacterium]MYG34109.1 prephenate dehydrogenase/arogenate dehydrogenase family protein [Gemmatimonadota bacterium]MYJ17995.1 prephenate dehydrogenase/arogenate dehydrogenase family protein [Gemmatimonadota bacteri